MAQPDLEGALTPLLFLSINQRAWIPALERTTMNSAMSAQSAIPALGGVPQEIFAAHQVHLSGSDLASRWGVAYSMSTVLEYEQRITHISTSERIQH